MTRKEELIRYLASQVYPTTQIVTGEITNEEYVISLAKHMADEIVDRRMSTHLLPFFAELAQIVFAECQHDEQINPTTVVNIRNGYYDVLIDRRTKWGNPFKEDRSISVPKHYEWVQTQPHLMAALHELKGRRLGCWCAPLPCHGDNYVRLIQELGI